MRTTIGAVCLAVLSSAAEAENPPPPPKPHISFQGMDVTDTSTTVAIGQQIMLSADQSGASESWSTDPPALIYGGFTALTEKTGCPLWPKTRPGGCVDYGTVNSLSKDIDFYFMAPGVYKFIYTYKTSDDKSASSHTTFNVVGPTVMSVQFPEDNVNITPSGCIDKCVIEFGKALYNKDLEFIKPLKAGIDVIVGARQPSGFEGRMEWVQTIAFDSLIFTRNGVSYSCPPQSGLDNFFPYPAVETDKNVPYYLPDNEAEDLPWNPLDSSSIQQFQRIFTAAMYLMWKANENAFVKRSFPVALGYVIWGWTGVAFFDSPTGWELDSISGPSKPIFESGITFPQWNSVVINEMIVEHCTPQ